MMRDGMGGWTFRTGRSVYTGGSARESWCFQKVLLPLLAALVLVGVPVGLWAAEKYYESLALAFAELEDRIVLSGRLNSTTQLDPHAGKPVWFVSTWTGTVADPAFGVDLPHALRLVRETEYCQWREWATESCDRCENDRGEAHDCNCVTTFHYDKGWRSHRIVSLLFDQPANHHNPQRDPYPSGSVVADDARATGVAIRPELLAKLRAPSRKVFFGRRTHHRMPWFWSEPEPRQEGTAALRGIFDTEAYRNHGFFYTDDDGWFFSPYQRSDFEHWFRRFGQWVEGSLLDWQLGDLLNSCTAGDIRVHFLVADPQEITVLGLVSGKSGEGQSVGLIQGLRSTDQDIGFVHGGEHSYDQMIRAEYSAAYGTCMWWRLGALLWGLVAERVLAAQRSQPSWPPNWWSACGAGVLLVAMVWSAVSGVSDWSGASTSMWTVAALCVGAALLHTGARKGPVCAAKKNA